MATFDPIFAADPNNPELIAQDASITIFNPDDPSMSPVTITDATGSPLLNPIQVNEKGWGPAFKTPDEDNLFRVGWSGAGFTGFFTSYESMRDAALDAKTAAQEAAAGAAGAVTEALASSTAAAAAAAGSASTAQAQAASALAAAQAAQAAAEAAASATAGGGFTVDPGNASVLLISTLDDGTVAVDTTNPNVLLITI